MKAILLLLVLISNFAFAQDPSGYMNAHDGRVYSLKTKGVKDFVVDVESDRLTKQVNDQMIFGKIENLIFRVFWTAQPERLAIEVIGLPEGFKEVKDELKLNIMLSLENLLPVPLVQKFAGYKFSFGNSQKEVIAEDKSGIAPIPTYVLKFDEQDRLASIEGKKPIGTFNIQMSFNKESFADGKWVLEEMTTVNSESGQSLTTKKELDYSTHEGIGVLAEVEVSTLQKWEQSDLKPISQRETITFKNYKINLGEGMKHFLAEPTSKK